MAESFPNKPHAIVFPYPYLGHRTPALILALNLASSGFAITYVQPEYIHHATPKLHDGDLFVGSGLDIRYATISDGFPLEYDRDLNFVEYWEIMVRDFPARVNKLIETLITTSSGDDFFLVADTLYTWPADIAQKHKLVNVSLWTEAATVFAIYDHLELLRENGHFSCTGNGKDLINYIPGVESIGTKDLMSDIQHPDAIPIVTNIIVKAFEQVKAADFILCNTVQELEPHVLLALNQNHSTYAIGPINFSDNIPDHVVQKTSLLSQVDCTQWLASKPPGSVLYISFGSIVQLNKHEIREIAHGLLESGVNFLWVLRIDDDDVFPDGFKEEVKDRGVVIPWCDQSRVLSSRSVGGFLTHCGWNSVLEGMWCGVPMLCYPFYVDQPTNRKLVVDDWKVGINLCDGGEVSREEFVSKVNALMRGNRSIELRDKSMEVKQIVRNARDKDGSSCRNFDRFVEDLKVKLHAAKQDTPKN